MTHLIIFIKAMDPKFITKRFVFLPYSEQKKGILKGKKSISVAVLICGKIITVEEKPQETC